ncbi:abhydrolase domain containing 14A [Chelydra serpentina]|uniref:Protein ABHD14A n=1 Tax=Chelydra serpentina TaxID=8475 RepID=A0A8T1TB03_CHESE|nr:abhydrolase domain containing 14A [Chelydra serpentina]
MSRREQVRERLSAHEGEHGMRLSRADATPERLDHVVLEQAALGEALASLSEELRKLVKCLEETAGRVEALDAKVVTTQSCVVKHAALMSELARGGLETERRVEELENRVRARNVRVIGVPATVGDTDLIPFLENLVPAYLGLNAKEAPMHIESAYRLPTKEVGDGARVNGAGTVLMTLSDFWARERILRAARACRATKFQGPKVSFFPDLSPATHARRQHLMVLKQAFVKEGAQAYVLYPAKLKVLCRGQTYVFRDCTSAACLLDELRQERLTMALIRNRLGLLVLGVLVTFVLYLLLPAIQHERFTSRAGSHKAQARAEEKGQRDVNVTILTGTIAGSPSILFREGFLFQRAGTPSPKRLEVVFLHGQAFTSKTWEDLGTLTLLSEEGYRSVAIDLPGYGNSPLSDAVSTEQGRVAFLQHVLKELGIQRPVLISPSMSGRYSVPFVLVHGAQLKGFVPIAPVGTQEYTAQQYQQVQTPTLIIYGERDTGLGAQSLQSLQQLPKHKVVALPDAGHACYLEKPREFHEALLAFLGELQ